MPWVISGLAGPTVAPRRSWQLDKGTSSVNRPRTRTSCVNASGVLVARCVVYGDTRRSGYSTRIDGRRCGSPREVSVHRPGMKTNPRASSQPSVSVAQSVSEARALPRALEARGLRFLRNAWSMPERVEARRRYPILPPALRAVRARSVRTARCLLGRWPPQARRSTARVGRPR